MAEMASLEYSVMTALGHLLQRVGRRLWTSRGLMVPSVLVVLLVLTLVLYWAILPSSAPEWTGFGPYDDQIGGPRGKTLWDWLDLLVIPVSLALLAFFLSRAEKSAEAAAAKLRAETDERLATDRQEQETLEGYFDRLSDLLLTKGLRTSPLEADVRMVARTCTLSVLRQLGCKRRGYVLQFLHEAGLVSANRIVDLDACDFSGLSLPGVDLAGADLSGVVLVGACLDGANLTGVNFTEADLSGCRLVEATLTEANLSGATLARADLTYAWMDNANLYKTMLDYASLRHVRLVDAQLWGASLEHAVLRGADLDGATIAEAVLDQADLRGLTESDELQLRAAGVIGPYRTRSLLQATRVTSEQLATSASMNGTILPNGTVHS